MSKDKRPFKEILREATESMRRYSEISRRDPGCQKLHGPYRPCSKAELRAAAAGRFCPACQRSRCEHKREVIKYWVDAGGHAVGEHFGPCYGCLTTCRTIERWCCHCCNHWYFVCDDCLGIKRNPLLQINAAAELPAIKPPRHLTWRQAVVFRLEIIKAAIRRLLNEH